MWFPDENAGRILEGLSLCHRRPPFLGPYLKCTFAMQQHQFVCDTIATTDSLCRDGCADGLTVIEDKQKAKTSAEKLSFYLDHRESPPPQQKKQKQLINTKPASNPPRRSSSSSDHSFWWCFTLLSFQWSSPCSATLSPPSFLQHPFLMKMINILRKVLQLLTHPYLLLTYLTFAVYWPSLFGELVFDDQPAIINNADIRPESAPWSQLWFNDYWGTPIKSPLSHKSYRPLTVTTFRLNYLFHELQPFGYHCVNLLLHSLVSILFYRFCLLFLNETPPKLLKLDNTTTSTFSPLQSTSFLIALLFTVHPIHTDCVSSVVGRAELLSALFYLSSILMWINSKSSVSLSTESSVYCGSASSSPLPLQLLFEHRKKLAAIGLAFVGFLCKEQSILALPYLALFELLDFGGVLNISNKTPKVISNNYSNNNHHHLNYRSSSRSGTFSSIPPPLSFRRKSPPSLGFPFWSSFILPSTSFGTLLILSSSLLFALYLRFSIIHFSMPTFSRFDNAAAHAGFPVRQLTAVFLSVYHFWLMLLPLHLSCDWSHSSLELINVNFYEPVVLVHLVQAVASLAVLGVFCWVTLRLMIRVMRTSVFLLPSASTAIRYRRTVAGSDDGDHQTSWTLKNDRWTRKCLHAIVLTVLPFLPASNLLFTTGFTIAERVMYLPSIGFLLLLAIGVRQMSSVKFFGDKLATRQVFHFGLLLVMIIFSLRTYTRSVDWTTESRLYESSLKVTPTNTKLLNNLGRLYEKDGRTGAAISLYERAIEIEPADIRSHLNLGNALAAQNRTRKAETVYRQALTEVEKELFSDDLGSRSSVHTLSPLYLTALVRLADLVNLDSGRATLEADLELIKQKMARLHSMMTSSSHYHNSKSKKRYFKGRPNCGNSVHCHSSRSMELNHLYNMAVLHYRQGRHQQALVLFDGVLALDHNHEDALLASAQIIERENIEALSGVAEDRLHQLLAAGRDDATIYFSLAMIAAKSNRHEEAKRHFRLAIERETTFSEAHYNLALLLVKELDNLNDNRHHHHHHHLKFDATDRNSNVQQAIGHLKRVLVLSPTHVKAMLVLGDLHADELLQLDKARYYYQLVLEHSSSNDHHHHCHQARHNLCVLCAKSGNLEASISCFEALRSDLSQQQSQQQQQPRSTVDDLQIERQIELLQEAVAVSKMYNENQSLKSSPSSSVLTNQRIQKSGGGINKSVTINKGRYCVNDSREEEKATSFFKNHFTDSSKWTNAKTLSSNPSICLN